MAVDMDNPPVLDMHNKCVDSDLQLDVDTMMLDLLLDAAIRALHEDQRSQQSGHLAATEWTDSTERALSAVDSKFLLSLCTLHQNRRRRQKKKDNSLKDSIQHAMVPIWLVRLGGWTLFWL